MAANEFVHTHGSLSFRRIVDVPFETCVAALDSWQRTGHRGALRFGESQVVGPVEHDHDTGTRRIQVLLARGLLRPMLRMRLDIDRWSASSSALELIPCGRVRPTKAYFRAGHLLLDSLTRSLPQHLPAARAWSTASQAHVPTGPGRPLSRASAGSSGPCLGEAPAHPPVVRLVLPFSSFHVTRVAWPASPVTASHRRAEPGHQGGRDDDQDS